VLRQFLDRLESGDLTPAALLELCLQRIASADPDVRAWVEVDPRPGAVEGLLRGIPFGAKDIIETRGMATEYGSPLYAGRRGERDAHVVAELRSAGAVLLGKTHTTAFASFDPAPTRNPRLAGHTPGGSSSGSAAAVAAGMVPFALGTQTLGSVLRPASFCGICGFKPTFGLIPMDGVLPFAPSLDTLGFFTESAADMECLWSRGFGGQPDARLWRAAYFSSVPVEEPMSRAVAVAVERLRASGVQVVETGPPADWHCTTQAARLINDYEGARTHAARFAEFGARIGTRLAELVQRGLQISEEEYAAAKQQLEETRRELSRIFWEYPAIVSPAAMGPAPAGLASTGDPSINAPWTALGVPAISVPLPVAGAPLGLQINAAWGRDDALVAVAADAERLLGSCAPVS
jgi:Asp-tRNA(Asn)/Glu-tRNA(Gln) amidotransferase A subunit family amidase